jgi:hypothetical protein
MEKSQTRHVARCTCCTVADQLCRGLRSNGCGARGRLRAGVTQVHPIIQDPGFDIKFSELKIQNTFSASPWSITEYSFQN